MIERKFVTQNIKEFQIQEYIRRNLPRVGQSYAKLVRTPLGEKIIIAASRPGLVVGKDGSTITKLTRDLKEHFKLENPQIELIEVENPHLDANIVAEMIANSLEQFGLNRFKGIAHKALSNVMNAGAIGVEILIGGKVPSSRAKTWRFYQGYIKKCGDIAIVGVHHAYARAELKTGTVGIQVRIMPPTTKLPDDITIHKPGEAGAPAEVTTPQVEVVDGDITSPSAAPASAPATAAAAEKPKKPRSKKSDKPESSAAPGEKQEKEKKPRKSKAASPEKAQTPAE